MKNDTLYLCYSGSEKNIYISYKDLEPLVLETGSVSDSIYGLGEFLPENVRLTDFSIESDNRDWKAKVIFSELNINKQSGKTMMDYGWGVLFVRLNADNVDKENEVGEKKE